jgi:chromate transporter
VNVVVLYLLLLQATVTSFSGLTSIPLVRNELVVQRAVITDEQLNSSLAIGQTTPGPVGLYVVIVGYFVDGVPGAIAGVLALATPALLAVPLLGLARRGRADRVAGAAFGIVIAASILTVFTALGLAASAIPTLRAAAIGGLALLLVAGTRLAPMWVVLLAGLAGLVVG